MNPNKKIIDNDINMPIKNALIFTDGVKKWTYDFTLRQAMVIEYLIENPKVQMWNVNTIKSKIEENGLNISKRHINRIIDFYQEKNLGYNIYKPRMNYSVKRKESNMGTMTATQIEIITTVNEGGWSIQEIANMYNVSDKYVRNILKDFHYMVTSDVLDTDKENVYFETEEDEFTTEGMDVKEEEEEVIDLVDVVSKVNNNDDDDGFWEVKIETVSACSKCNSEVDVYMNRTARTKAMMYMKWAGPREWLAYLIGEFKDNAYYVTDLFLPDQRTSSTLVDNVVAENYNEMTVIGVIHSHHEMGAGDADNPHFSGHDAAFINSNHNLSLLAGRDRKSNGFKIVGIARAKTPCGSFMKIKANVLNLTEELTDEEKAMKKEFFEKTQTQTRPVQNFANGGSYRNFSQQSYGGVTNVNHGNGRTTYHFNGGGYPGNQVVNKKCNRR